jgi:2-phospho-L-lactate/phosphoenolpyruvate guanylyltransferase
MILVPVKLLSNAKQRLASVLDQASRTKLAHAMLTDVLETLAACPDRPPVTLVTSDPFATDLARKFNFGLIIDNRNHSETDAIEMATQICQSHGAQATLVLPGDIPLIQVWEVEKILQSSPAEGSVLVPGADGRGTNAVWRSPAALFPLRFGHDSFRPHLAAARATRKPCVVLSLPGIGLDIDSPPDLAALVAASGDTGAQRLARQWGVEDLPLAANQ